MRRLLQLAAAALAAAICETKLCLGRRRHDNRCDDCGTTCSTHATDKLDFPFGGDLEALSTVEKLRAMLNAEHVRYCFECAIARELNIIHTTQADTLDQADLALGPYLECEDCKVTRGDSTIDYYIDPCEAHTTTRRGETR